VQSYTETQFSKTAQTSQTAAKPAQARSLLARLQAYLDGGWQRNLHHAQALARVYAGH